VILCHDLAAPEAPLALGDGTWLVAELAQERGTVAQVLADGTRREVVWTGRPNGLARTADGTIWCAETLTPSIVTITLDGQKQTVLTRVGDTPLLWPNDLAVGPDGALYITDSGALISDFLDGDLPKPEFMNVRCDGKVIRYDPTTGETQILDRGLAFANGIAFDAAGDLFVSETLTGDVHRYRGEGGRVTGSREYFGSVLWDGWDGGDAARGPDGMAFSADGRLFVAVFGQGDVTILKADGSQQRRIPLAGKAPTNVAFGLNGENRIYVTEDELGQLTVHDVDGDGLALHGWEE
jgi:gluconolactonase